MTETAASGVPLLTSPLDDRHRDLGAKMADFGGWEMPIEYGRSGGGVVAEHTAVRESVGVFDVSHLGKATVAGPGARDFVNRCLTADLDRIGPGRAQYTLCCTADGGVIDDVFSYLVSDSEVFLMPNAANAAEVIGKLAEAAVGTGVTVTDQHSTFAVLAVQGPRSADVLSELDLPSDLDYVSFVDAEFDSYPVRICRTGYTGEHGYELIPRAEHAVPLWDALLESARGLGGMPAGLGARDTLRTEMGYPLHGQDLSRDISPLQAGSSWAVGWRKPEFWGRDALLAERAAGPTRQLRGIVLTERGIPRPHMTVTRDGTPVGVTTSGTFSPSLRQGIALALVDATAGLVDGSEISVDIRGRSVAGVMTALPFVPSHVR